MGDGGLRTASHLKKKKAQTGLLLSPVGIGLYVAVGVRHGPGRGRARPYPSKRESPFRGHSQRVRRKLIGQSKAHPFPIYASGNAAAPTALPQR